VNKRSKVRSAPAPPGKKIMTRKASDNVYLHKDFHGALNQALIYLEENFGVEAVRNFLHQFARALYSPLTKELEERGLEALKAHLDRIYSLEGAEFRIECTPDELKLNVAACPAVGHIRRMGLPISRHFDETENSVNAAICEGTPYEFELLEYDPESGRSVQRFSRRRA
jgi:hypothetical protein